MTTTLTNQRLAGRAVISPALFDRLVQRVVIDGGFDQDLAERMVDQAIAFLGACAHNTSAPLTPSELVDVGWHTFLLYTREYAAFCQDVAGHFLHHVPVEPGDPVSIGQSALTRTVAAIDRAGFVVDVDLWAHASESDCTGCHNGCHDDPPPPHT